MNEQGASRRFVWSIVTAQMLVQIGAFSLPALLPAYIEQWHLTRTEAGSLVGIFFAAYVIAVPLLVALTDRVPARYRISASRLLPMDFGGGSFFERPPASDGPGPTCPASRSLPTRWKAMRN